ncbi:SusC/RagA family TonB-linked outer membrane protein [Dyadobacter chenwenxiniae]|uniref:SusC/RagA family TonB-linked outer membrane protein n=1 Tax=Dyadobacter chenwenxiniae TaxID=2906456 RepID=A0A9X1PJJ9_9BACT|nr:SusC/RagA family TonB-linked outer membrane protein [Dyadobacter chenwenxiniae]MCF0061184.1 SusC/RagA family TonB-linked outer membrane protein [Dyadobacter chenwenxiniae]UON81008.1 SusC/RagA family TonB-linked outer membrane protein [Dyadobacter chenwenxiniae]
MNITLSAKQWAAIGIVLMTQSSLVAHSQIIAYASIPTRQHNAFGQEMKLKNVLLDLQKHYGVEIIFEDRLVRSVNVAPGSLDFNQSLEKNLSLLLQQNGLTYKKTRKNTFVITEVKAKEAAPVKEEGKETSALPEQSVSNEPVIAALGAQSAAIDRTIKGKVADEAGAGLPGVSVVLKGTQRGTSTGANGEFTLDIPDGGAQNVLVLSFVGYKSQEVTIGSQSTIDVAMLPDENALDEIIVVGYGTVKKSDLTGAVGTIKGEVLQERPASSLNQGLSGRIAGVNVSSNSGRPGGRANIRIRGASSISVSNNPLYVIDGVILNAVDLANGSTPIDYINPNDIASIEVLKDASSTAIYGARGANGVILVTTKRGTSGGGKVTYDTDFSIGVAPKKLPVLNSKEFLAVEEQAYVNAAKFDPVGWATGTKYTDPKLKRTNPLLFDASGNPLYDTDWQDETFQKAFTQNHQLGLTGGSEKGSYGAFLNYRNENGIVRESWQKRFAGRFVFDSQIKSWLKVGGTLGYTDQNEKQIDQLGGGGITAMRQVLEALPIIPVKYPDGKWASNRDYPGMEGGDSPLRVGAERLSYLRTQTMLGNMYATISLAPGLDFRSTVGTNVINQREDYFAAAGLQYISNNGDASVQNRRFNSWQFENYLTYVRDFGKIHSVNAMLGLSWQHVDRFDNLARSQNFTDTYFQFNNLGAGATALAPTSNAQAYGLNSYFARLNYSLMDKYLVTFTGRIDGSSKFGDANRYAFFPSAALAWRVSEEEFLKSSAAISNLKIRASYGATGNSEIPAYRALAGMTNNIANVIDYSVIFGGNRAIGTGISRMSNSNLQWEKTQQVDLGIELGLFSNRLSFELDLYRRKVNEMLLDAPLPLSSGYSSIFTNVGSMENKGVEFAVNSTNIKAGDFSWNTTFNISVNKNKVLALSGGSDIFSGATVIRVGEPVGSFFGRVNLGTWSTGEADLAKSYGELPGDVKYADLNEDGAINDLDRAIIGKGIPDGFGTFLNTFQYKAWSLTVDLQYMYGNDVLDRSIHSAEDRQGIANSYKTVLNAWTETNQNTPIAQVRPINAGYDTNNDSHKVTDGSFIRGRNLLLAYSFPASTVSKLKLDRLRIYGSVQNFFVTTKYKGYDPEVSNSGSPFDQGFGLYDYPKPRVFMLGLNIGL